MEKKQHKVAEKKGGDEAEQQLVQVKKRKRKEVFPFGNYKNYYGYRIGGGFDEDPRLKVFKKEWFQDKKCLDIGCNSGIITIQIAKKFRCRSILGIDIDSNRVEDAYWHLRKIVKKEKDERNRAQASRLDVSGNTDGRQLGLTVIANAEEEVSKDCSPLVERDLHDIVSFQQENFVHSQHPLQSQYDTILCLSVTKWIHLNWGDDGLITLFTRIWRLLHPGGIFVLEPQPWRSYEKNRRVSQTTAANYQNIVYHPEQFQEILLDKIGFRRVEVITSDGLSDSKTGFDRPIFAFQK
ncbi:probable RNA methyltransferase At5g51130 [Mangifera indica]|uniref:probable RNA methyltransferase At5g51130 n=1 Tax=Mangifera indica TaxID=29780 RepID=UPI001CFA931B|nr:probable RNA methyltransferase At5g51130 [Mangifera indica]